MTYKWLLHLLSAFLGWQDIFVCLDAYSFSPCDCLHFEPEICLIKLHSLMIQCTGLSGSLYLYAQRIMDPLTEMLNLLIHYWGKHTNGKMAGCDSSPNRWLCLIHMCDMSLSQLSKLKILQVSHHPPILAFHCDNCVNNYVLYGEVEIKNKFTGKSVEVIYVTWYLHVWLFECAPIWGPNLVVFGEM
jgi:hypothetical protein